MSTIYHVNKYLFSFIIVKFIHIKSKIVSVLDVRYPDYCFLVCRLQCESNTFYKQFCTLSERALLYLKVSRLRTLAFLIRIVVSLGWAWGIGGVYRQMKIEILGEIPIPVPLLYHKSPIDSLFLATSAVPVAHFIGHVVGLPYAISLMRARCSCLQLPDNESE
jgi:hypothetical protein